MTDTSSANSADQPSDQPGDQSQAQMIARTQEIMRILDSWGLNPDAQLAILGLQNEVRSREIRKYQDGLKVLPSNEDTDVRTEHILGIASALFTAYPSRTEAGATWMAQRQAKLRGRTPIQCLLQDGCRGMVKVRSTVDCAWAWEQDDKHNPCWDKNK